MNEDIPPTFISVVLHLYGGKGHEFSYQTAVGEAVRLNGWDHLSAVSPDPVIKKFPREWRVEYVDSGVLDYEGVEVKRLLRHLRFWPFITSVFVFASALSGMLRREIKASPNWKIVFVETFNPLQLLSLVFALIPVRRERIKVWLLYRGGPDWGGPNHRLFARSFSMACRVLNPIFEFLVGKENFLLLTDSDKLRMSLPSYYHRPVHVLPIPHTPVLPDGAGKPERHGDGITCWWPGAPRPEKGLETIGRLASIKGAQAKQIKLVVAKSAGFVSLPEGIRIESIDDRLSAEEYNRQFLNSDLILLPYDKDIYSESTSGIFTECLVAGVTPLTSDGTWMAHELRRYDLQELIIDWHQEGLIRLISRAAHDEQIRIKVKKMHEEYRRYHCISSFAQELKRLSQI